MNTENSQKKEFKKGTQPFEFTIFLNENIVVQRYFNVIGFNNKSINSMNFKETIDYNKYIIEKHLKDKSLDFMNDNARAFYENPNFDQNLSKDVLKIYHHPLKVYYLILMNLQYHKHYPSRGLLLHLSLDKKHSNTFLINHPHYHLLKNHFP